MLQNIFLLSICSEENITAVSYKKDGSNYLNITTNDSDITFNNLKYVSNTHQTVPQCENILDFTSKFNNTLGNKRNKTYTYNLPSNMPLNKLYYLIGTTSSGKYIITQPYYLNKKNFISQDQLKDSDLTINANKKSKAKDDDLEDDNKSGSKVSTWIVLGVGLLVIIILLLIVCKMCYGI